MATALQYAIRKHIDLPYEQAVEAAKAAFKEEGFGVLTEIDVRKTMKEKLGVDFRRYVILGTCNPQLAHRALSAEIGIGVLLPCNVVVYEDDAGSTVAAQNPLAAMEMIGNPDLTNVAAEASERIRRALERL